VPPGALDLHRHALGPSSNLSPTPNSLLLLLLLLLLLARRPAACPRSWTRKLWMYADVRKS
jgi:hypothetical protein